MPGPGREERGPQEPRPAGRADAGCRGRGPGARARRAVQGKEASRKDRGSSPVRAPKGGCAGALCGTLQGLPGQLCAEAAQGGRAWGLLVGGHDGAPVSSRLVRGGWRMLCGATEGVVTRVKAEAQGPRREQLACVKDEEAAEWGGRLAECPKNCRVPGDPGNAWSGVSTLPSGPWEPWRVLRGEWCAEGWQSVWKSGRAGEIGAGRQRCRWPVELWACPLTGEWRQGTLVR